MPQPTRRAVPDTEASGAMMRLITGAWAARMVHTAAELGLADHLGEGPRDAGELAAATASHAPSLARLLRALAAIGVLREDEDGAFALTELGQPLRSWRPTTSRA